MVFFNNLRHVGHNIVNLIPGGDFKKRFTIPGGWEKLDVQGLACTTSALYGHVCHDSRQAVTATILMKAWRQ